MPGLHHETDIDNFLAQVRLGASIRAACAASGLPRRSVMRWLADSRTDDASDDARIFAERYERARAVKIRELEDAMAVHAELEWRACTALLKALDRERWGDGMPTAEAEELRRLRLDRERDVSELAALKVRLAALEVADRTPRGGNGAE